MEICHICVALKMKSENTKYATQPKLVRTALISLPQCEGIQLKFAVRSEREIVWRMTTCWSASRGSASAQYISAVLNEHCSYLIHIFSTWIAIESTRRGVRTFDRFEKPLSFVEYCAQYVCATFYNKSLHLFTTRKTKISIRIEISFPNSSHKNT